MRGPNERSVDADPHRSDDCRGSGCPAPGVERRGPVGSVNRPGHLYEEHRAHTPALVRDLSPRRRDGADVADDPVSYTHLRAHETPEHLVCRLLLEKKKK